jgi:tetratricopeptide (TPR) repeat protein
MKLRRAWSWLLVAAVGLGLTSLGAIHWYQTTRPDYRLSCGQEAVRQADFATAEEMARRLERAGYADHARLLQATMHLALDQPNDAVTELNQIASTELRLDGAVLYGEWLVRHQIKPGEAERLLRDFVLAERPDNLVAYQGLAAIYYDQGAWALAVLHLLRWAELDPRDGRPHRLAGLTYRDMDHFGLAIPCYREALRRDLKEQVVQEVKEELAECLVKQSLYREAWQALKDCGPRAEEAPALIALRGDCLLGLGKPADAVALLDRALQRHPQSTDLLRVRGKLAVALEKPMEAANLFGRLLEHDPQDIGSRYQLGLVYERLGRRDEAAKHLKTVEEIKHGLLELTQLIQQAGEKPWDAAHQQRLAKMCEQLGRPDLARRWVRAQQRSEARDPGFAVKSQTLEKKAAP